MSSRSRRIGFVITLLMVIAVLIASQPQFAPNITGLFTVVSAQSSSTVYLPFITNFIPAPVPTTGEWTQFAHDPQRTGYTDQAVPTPWRWKWSWNGPNSSGGVASPHRQLPRNVQPITGGGRVYIAAGSNGIFAINSQNGQQLWNRTGIGSVNSTPAYDPQTDSLYVVSTNGNLYRLNAVNGQDRSSPFDTDGTSNLPLPPAMYNGQVYFSMGNSVYAVDKNNMSQAWRYDAGSPVDTPPAISSSGLVIVASRDLFAHAIHMNDGSRKWRTKPTPLSPGDPASSADNSLGAVSYSWPVVAEQHGLVFIRYQLDWQSMYTWSPWPSTNQQMRTNLNIVPTDQPLFALNLSDGLKAFTLNVGNGGFGDGNRMPIGPAPVIKVVDGKEVAYVVMRGSPCLENAQPPCEGRNDSHLGELMLDGSTVSGFQAGYVRFMRNNTFFPSDEHPTLTMSGNDIFIGHWMFGAAHRIANRGGTLGTGSSNPITMSNLPHIVTSASNCGFSPSHYCPNNLIQDGDPRGLPAGFYIYYNAGTVYDQYWRGYSTWIVSGDTIYYLSTDGALVALESGNPTSGGNASEVPAGDTPLQAAPGTPEPPVLDGVIDYTQAWDAAGSIATVEGQVVVTINNGKTILLGFADPHVGVFKIQIPLSSLSNFPDDPQVLYAAGTRIRVHGLIGWYQGDPTIYVSGPEQIEVID